MKRLVCRLLGHHYARRVEGFKCTADESCIRCGRFRPIDSGATP